MNELPLSEDHSDKQSHQPSYIYRDESLAALKRGDPIVIKRQKRFIRLRLCVIPFFVALTIGCAMILPVHDSAVYATYQQGSCTIMDKHVEKHSSTKGRPHYHPVFSYKVHTDHDGLAYASGFDGPLGETYSDFKVAQEIADRYQIGQRTSCWYNPSNPSHAFIVFDGYSWASGFVTFIVFLPCYALVNFIVCILFYTHIWPTYALRKRGVLTQGRVLRQYEYRGPHSEIGYQAAEGVTKERSISAKGFLPIGSLVPVCYDPFNPDNGYYNGWPTESEYVPAVMMMGVWLIGAVIAMLSQWFVP